MDYFAASGSEEGLSLQDMIENDFRSNFAEHGDKIGGQLSGVHPSLGVTAMEYMEGHEGGAITVDISDAGKLDLSWLHGMSSGLHEGQPENTDPNLLVDPSTGMPISEASPVGGQEGDGAGISPRDAMTGHTASASQTLNRVNTLTALPASRIIHTAQGQFITIPTTLAAGASSPITHIQYVPTSAPASPLRQHLQNIPQTPQSPMAVDYLPQSPKTPKNNKQNGAKVYPKPVYSYSCLIAMALKNSETGCLPVSEIYNFMTENFPYFKTAPDGWKNSVRHNLSLNKCFEKIENLKSNGNTKKGCLWTMNPAKIEKMDEEIAKWRKKDPIAIKKSMSKPEVLDQLEKGNLHCGSPRHSSFGNGSAPSTPTRSNSQNNNNNNNSKLDEDLGSLSNSHSIARAVRNLSNITGNINVIEIKPPASTVKVEEHSSLSNLTSDDLNILENGLTLDPALGDLALQNGLFDDFSHDDLSISDITGTSSPLSFTFTSAGLSSSPLTIQNGTPIKEEQTTTFVFSNGAVTSAVTTPSESKLSIARTISAQT